MWNNRAGRWRERYFITSVKKFKLRLATGKKCSIYPLLPLLLPDTSYILIKSNILKYMRSLFQILFDWFSLFYKPYRQETIWKANQAARKYKRIVKHKCWYCFYKTWLFSTSTSTRYPLNLNQEYYSQIKMRSLFQNVPPFYRPYRQETAWTETRKSSVKKIWRIVQQKLLIVCCWQIRTWIQSLI